MRRVMAMIEGVSHYCLLHPCMPGMYINFYDGFDAWANFNEQVHCKLYLESSFNATIIRDIFTKC